MLNETIIDAINARADEQRQRDREVIDCLDKVIDVLKKLVDAVKKDKP